eukprot:gene30346-36667_t
MYWKRLLLLPTILFSFNDKALLNKRLDMQDPVQPEQLDPDDILPPMSSLKFKRVSQLVQAGQFSDAFSLLTRDNAIAQPSDEALEKLCAKHPEPANRLQRAFEAIKNFQLPSDQCIESTPEGIREIIRDCPLHKAPGLDKLRYDHLRALVGRDVEPSAADFTFCSKLSQVINILLSDKAPAEVGEFLRGNILIALPKGADDVRPVGMGSVLRKIASKCLWKALEDFNE